MKILMRFSIEELASRSGLSSEIIINFVSNNWVNPVDSENLIFDEEDLARIMLIYELQHVMGINDEGIPVILHLIDQLNRMHIEIKTRFN